jgi:hypothetical protein
MSRDEDVPMENPLHTPMDYLSGTYTQTQNADSRFHTSVHTSVDDVRGTRTRVTVHNHDISACNTGADDQRLHTSIHTCVHASVDQSMDEDEHMHARNTATIRRLEQQYHDATGHVYHARDMYADTHDDYTNIRAQNADQDEYADHYMHTRIESTDQDVRSDHALFAKELRLRHKTFQDDMADDLDDDVHLEDPQGHSLII